jgi:beta-glucanase (GH16 family)
MSNIQCPILKGLYFGIHYLTFGIRYSNKASYMKKVHLVICVLLMMGACKKSESGGSTSQPDPVVSISDVTMFEGDGGTTAFEFTLSLSKQSAKEVSVTYGTEEGTAKASEDFTAVTGSTIKIQPGETQKQVTVSVVADDLREGNDTFTVKLQSAVNAAIVKNKGVVTIRNDDSKVKINNNGYDAPASYAGYTLAWSDEFNGAALDATAWSHQNGDGCPNICGWGNNELEYYTGRPENIFFQDGKMIIEARPENLGGRNYTSSKILSEGKKTFKFGRIDFRAILPKGKGIWPAFWMLPQNNVFGGWPRSGEIDIMEVVGHEPNRTHGTLHFGPGPGSTSINRNVTLTSGTFNDEFHVFSLEWKQDQLKWYLDGNLFSTINKADLGANNYPFNETFFFIINLAVGGNWPGSPDAGTYFPQWLIVDYVRVYQ